MSADALLAALAPVVRHCARLAADAPPTAPIEVECRTRIADATTFYALVQRLAACASDAWFTDHNDLLCAPRADEPAPLRVTYSTGADAALQYALHKRRLLREPRGVQLAGSQQRWLVDAAQEHYRVAWTADDEQRVAAASAANGALLRAKQRASFVLRHTAPAWRVDATRVEERRSDDADAAPLLRYELELELARFDAEPGALLAQAAALLAQLGVR